MKANIATACVFDDFNKQLGSSLARKLEFYYLDIKDYLAFNLVDTDKVTQLCGVDYLNEIYTKTVEEAASYYNTVIALNLSFVMDKHNVETLKKRCILVYIKVSEKDILKLIETEKDKFRKLELKTLLTTLPERNKFIEGQAGVVVNASLKNVKKTMTDVIKKIEDKFLG